MLGIECHSSFNSWAKTRTSDIIAGSGTATGRTSGQASAHNKCTEDIFLGTFFTLRKQTNNTDGWITTCCSVEFQWGHCRWVSRRWCYLCKWVRTLWDKLEQHVTRYVCLVGQFRHDWVSTSPAPAQPATPLTARGLFTLSPSYLVAMTTLLKHPPPCSSPPGPLME